MNLLKTNFSINTLIFTFKHMDSIIALIITIIIFASAAIALGIVLKKRDNKTKNIPIIVCWALLVVMEFMKIYYLIGENQSFNASRYPIVFCSIVLYLYPLFIFKKNKFSNMAMGFSTIPNMIAVFFVILTVGDYDLINGSNFSIIHFHSIVYHTIMLAVAIYIAIVGLYKFEFKDSISVGAFLFGYIAFCTILSIYIKADISLFGPYNTVFGFMHKQVGYVVTNLALGMLTAFISVLVYSLINIPRFIKANKAKRKEVLK